MSRYLYFRKIRSGLLALLVAITTTACSTTGSRIEANRDSYNTYTAEVQQAIKRGEVWPGFTREQVFIALGEPWSRDPEHWIYAGCNWRTVRSLLPEPELVLYPEHQHKRDRHSDTHSSSGTVSISVPLHYRDSRLCRRYIGQVIHFDGDRVTRTEKPVVTVWLEPGWR